MRKGEGIGHDENMRRNRMGSEREKESERVGKGEGIGKVKRETE